MNPPLQREKFIIALLCIIGVFVTAYGMFRDHDGVFLVGLGFVVTGYLLLRRKLKKTPKKKHRLDNSNQA